MSELHLHACVRRSRDRAAGAQANAKHRDPALHKFLGWRELRSHRVPDHPGPLESKSVRFVASACSADVVAGTTGHATSVAGQQAQNAALDAEVVRHHVQSELASWQVAPSALQMLALVPLILAARGHDLGEIHALQSGNLRAACTAAVSSMMSPVMMQPDCAHFVAQTCA